MNNETEKKQHQSGYIDCNGNNLSRVEDPQHPQGKIVLLDGRELECYPKEAAEGDFVSDEVKLDTTGQYLTVGKKPKTVQQTEEEEKQLRKLFLDNAFYLLAHRERILSDSRMFLTPVAVQSGLAYTGTSGFRNPTVGVYLEWWAVCDGAMCTSKDGERSLVYRLAGSPMSGMNSCSEVLENGESRAVKVLDFANYWPTFMKVNTRYTEAKHECQCYSLQQLLDILRSEDNGECDFSQIINTMFMQNEIDNLKKKLKKREDELSQCSKMWYELYADAIMKLYDEKVREYYKEYKLLEVNSRAEINSLREQKRNLKASLKRGEIDNVTYQRTIMPMNKRIKDIDYNLSKFRYKHLRETFPDEEHISFSMIESYIEKESL